MPRNRPPDLSHPIYRALAAAIERLTDVQTPERSHVFMESLGEPTRYVQFGYDNGVLRFEAVSNRYLPDGFRLDERQQGLLRELGWRPPGEGHPNWHRRELVDRAFDFEAITRVVQRTLSEVYGVPPEGLGLRCTWGAEETPSEDGGYYGFEKRTFSWAGVGTGQPKWRN